MDSVYCINIFHFKNCFLLPDPTFGQHLTFAPVFPPISNWITMQAPSQSLLSSLSLLLIWLICLTQRCGLADCGTNVPHGCALFWQNSEYVSSYLPHLQSTPDFPLPSLPHIQCDHMQTPLFLSYFLFLHCCMTWASEKGVKSMGRGERDDILIWIDWLALDWDHGLADCGTYFLCRCGLSGQNEILFIALTCFFSKLVSPSSLKASRNFFHHLQPLPSPSSSRGTPNGMIICCVSLRNIVTTWCNMDATYTDAKDISEHEASG